MRRNKELGNMTWLVLFVGLCLQIVSAVAATVGTDAEGWSQTTEGDVVISYDAGGNIIVTFRAQPAPPFPATVTLIANAGTSGGAFVGDYVAIGVEGVSLKTKGDGHVPGSARLEIRGQSGRVWRNYSVEFSDSPDVWMASSVSLERDAGWATQWAGDLDAMWQEDLHNVAMIAVVIAQNGGDVQRYSVAEFRLCNENGFITPPAQLAYLEQELLDQFGTSSIDDLSEAQKNQDSDHDGMTDLKEILAGTDPNDANSIFEAEIVSPATGAEGITIRWPCLEGAMYTVLRTMNLVQGFNPLISGLTVSAEEAQAKVKSYTDSSATGSGPYYYKVMKE